MNDQAPAPAPYPDPYDQPVAWWKTYQDQLVMFVVFAATALLTVLSFPPFDLPELAYVFATPAVFWAYRRPSFKVFALTTLAGNMLGWTIVLGWLHHVSWLGLFLLGPFIGAWVGSWFLALWWVMPRILGRSAVERILIVFGLAALWVLIEWSRTWLLTGFPWLPLSSSQWKRVAILQVSAFTGAYGVSFVLISMNIGFGAYAHRLLLEGKRGLHKRSQEFFACLFLLIVCITVMLQETFNHGRYAVNFGRIAIVQPNIPQEIKWDASKAPQIQENLVQSTLHAAKTWPDLILWPEACTPLAVRGEASSQAWVEAIVKKAKKPLLLGSMSIENAGMSTEVWHNGAFLVTPGTGLQSKFYAKRHLVPFGEYVPLRPVLGWLDKVVPVGGDFQPGIHADPIMVKMKEREVPVGPLICYEDVFPTLARESAEAGAELLVVLTNDAWYKDSPAAVQHATHSILRAIETRRPVIRCGNNGWSGLIDEYGNVREFISDEEENIFVRANATVDVTRDLRWVGKQSFYTEHGDWFVVTCAFLTGFAFLLVRVEKKPSPISDADSEA